MGSGPSLSFTIYAVQDCVIPLYDFTVGQEINVINLSVHHHSRIVLYNAFQDVSIVKQVEDWGYWRAL